MQFTKKLREPIRRGEITKTVRIWKAPRVKVGNAYKMERGHVVIDSIHQIALEDITTSLARETGFGSAVELIRIAKHGQGENVYLIAFHYLEDQ